MSYARRCSVRECSRRSYPALSLLLGLALPLAAQQETPMPEKVFQDHIGVEIVNIDVTVTDKKGHAVDGLTRDDFELRIDGQLVEVANFYAVTSNEAPVPVPEPRAQPSGVADDATPPAPADDPIHVVVYVDSFYLTPVSRKRVLRDLPVFFEEQVATGARIMLVTHDQTSRALTPFTADLDELKRGLETIEGSPAVGIRQTTARRVVFDNIQQIYEMCEQNPRLEPCRDCLQQMVEMVRFYSMGLISERRAAMDSLGNIVNALSVLEGKKALLHVSDGIQQQSGIDLFFFLGEQICPGERQEFQEHYLRQDVGDLNDLVNQANASRVTFYTLEAAGMRGFSSASAEYQNSFFKPDATNDMLRIGNLQGTLHYLSEETGGKAILNANRFAPDLAKLTSEFRTYYSLGYQPAHSGRGHSHRVSVKTPKKKGYEVRYRRSFLHKKSEQQLADRALGAVIFGIAQNPLEATVEVGAQSAGSDGRVNVALDFSVPVDKLTLIPHEDLRQGQLAAIIAAPDEDTKKIAIRRKQIDITLPAEQTASSPSHYQFGVNVELVPGDYRLGVGIWDEIAAEGSFFGLQVEVRPQDADPVESGGS